MKPILIVYATREGHTRQVAQHIAAFLRERQFPVELYDARDSQSPPQVARFSAVLLAASLHMRRHEKEMQRFIERERGVLSSLPTAFLSLSLSAAGAHDPARAPEERLQTLRQLNRCTDELFEKTRWRPDHTEFVAGALMYTHYNPLVRWIMRRIAQKEGASTDTSRDHVFTDWGALDRFAEGFASSLAPELRAAS